MGNTKTHVVPDTYKKRADLRALIHTFVYSQALIPPLSIDELSDLSDRMIREHSLDPLMKGWMMVEINNRVWMDTVASVPYDKRILLLPKCLSNSSGCEAEIDELGLLCHRCKRCSIPDLQDKAESLGMMSLVAEGFTTVVGLVENRVVDVVIGVSCLDSLEKAFPLLINNAVPGLAIPLNMDGCKDTEVDYHYVSEMMSMRSTAELTLLDYNRLKSTLNEWFTADSLTRLLSPTSEQTSRVAIDWLGGDGKRWRPYLLAATYQALSRDTTLPEKIQRTAIAVECFHKASLVHDDIQDNDTERYGKQTVYSAYGVPVAINVGDLLLGEGYRLLASTENVELIKIASEAHLSLCRGQGMELEWSLSPSPLTMDFVLDIFCNKTVPAFDVSLIMGVVCAGDDPMLRNTLHAYSRALGIAYQLLDDIEDFKTDAPIELRPSSVLAALCEQSTDQAFIDSLLHTNNLKAYLSLPENKPLLQAAINRVEQMAEVYRKETLQALQDLSNVELKRLLFRVAKRILKQ